MASINEKLNYINETKSLIKDKLNNLGSEIDNETTFREYAEKIKNLYEEWPKISDENTTITLNNTKKGKMNLQLKGNTSQNGTPTPNAPQDIYVVSGDNSINVIGKNLLLNIRDEGYTVTSNGITFKVNADKSITVTGTATNVASMSLNTPTPVTLTAGTYTLSKKDTADVQVAIWYDSASVFTSARGTTKTVQKTVSQDTTYNNWRTLVVVYQGVTVNTTIYPMLEKNSSATTYEAYQSQSYSISLGDTELCKIGDYQDKIYKDSGKWYLHKEIGKVVLDGSESWDKRGDGDGSTTITFQIPGAFGSFGTNSEYCNRFVYEQSSSSGNEGIGIGSEKNAVYIQIKRNRLSSLDVAGFKTWLSNNNTTLYYVLATPIYTEITDSTLINQLNAIENIESYNNQTNILEINNNLPFIINATALMKNSD